MSAKKKKQTPLLKSGEHVESEQEVMAFLNRESIGFDKESSVDHIVGLAQTNEVTLNMEDTQEVLGVQHAFLVIRILLRQE